MVLAAMEPDRAVTLVEPMERRAVWLHEAVTALGWTNVTVVRARAEEVGEEFDAVTARAVAAVDKLVKWCAPLMKDGGAMVFLKGRAATEEIDKARFALRKARLTAELRSAPTLPDIEPTTVVRLTRTAAREA
jgi:16S rRNA (guanine527-N7)-methyltransferase